MAPLALRVGDRVRLRGLAARPELNGRLGQVLRLVKESGRYKVALEGEVGDASLSLKDDNLEVLPTYGEALARSALDARLRVPGPVLDASSSSPSSSSRGSPSGLRTVHILGATTWELGLQYAAFREDAALRPGDAVVLSGLSARPELNGARGVAVRWFPEKGRWKVELESHTCEAGFVLKPENMQPLPVYRYEGFEGPWLQDGDWHCVRGCKVYGPDGEMVEDIEVLGADAFAMTLEGQRLEARLEAEGQRLLWSDGDIWVRPPLHEQALVQVVLVGPELPDEYPEGELRFLGAWPEPGVAVACFRGRYEAFASSPGFVRAELAVLAHPGLCLGGVSPGLFEWAPALRALAGGGLSGGEADPRAPELCVCLGAEPYAEGEWLGDGLYDPQVLRAFGFEILAPVARSSLGCRAPEHPTCGWHLWASSLAFRWPPGAQLGSEEDWLWRGYFNARRTRAELPRFRFRPAAPEHRPPALAELEARRAAREAGGDEEDAAAAAEEQELACVTAMEWVGITVATAWSRGGGATPAAAAAAGATAAAEEFADRTRSRPLPPGQEHVVAAGASEVAARVAALLRNGPGTPTGGAPATATAAAAAAAVAAVAVFEALAQEALWNRSGSLDPDMVGHLVNGALKCAEKANVQLSPGLASAVGGRATEAYERLRGPSRPPVGCLGEEFQRFVEGVCDSAGVGDAGLRKAIGEAVVANLDLAIPALGGREAALRLSLKMHDAPPCRKVAS